MLMHAPASFCCGLACVLGIRHRSPRGIQTANGFVNWRSSTKREAHAAPPASLVTWSFVAWPEWRETRGRCAAAERAAAHRDKVVLVGLAGRPARLARDADRLHIVVQRLCRCRPAPPQQSTQPIHPDMLPSSHFVCDTRSCTAQRSSREGSAPEVRGVGQRRAAAGHELLEPHVEALVPAHDVAVLLHLLVLAQHVPCTSQHAQHTLDTSAAAAYERQQLGTRQGAGSKTSPRYTKTKGKEGRNCLYMAALLSTKQGPDCEEPETPS